jgi:hypothetical protein
MDDLQDHGDEPGSFEEKISDITTRHQTFKKDGGNYHQGILQPTYGEIETALFCCDKVDGLSAGIAHNKLCSFLYLDDGKFFYDIVLNNCLRISNTFERINFNQLTIAYYSQPQSDLNIGRGYLKRYQPKYNDDDQYSEMRLGFINVEDGSWLLRQEQNQFGSFYSCIDTPLFDVDNMEESDEVHIPTSIWDDNPNPALQFIGAKLENGSRNYFSNPKSLLEYVFHKIKHEIDQGSPPMKLFDEITAHRADEYPSNAGEMLDDPSVRKIYRAKYQSEYDLYNEWMAEEARSKSD